MNVRPFIHHIRTALFFLVLLLGAVILLEPARASATTLYADNTLSSDCTTGNYSIANRSCSGSDGRAYGTIQSAVNVMDAGDTILVRGGTYQERVDLPSSKDGTSWVAGNFNTIASYPGEWAILDGQNSGTGPVIGREYSGGVPSHDDDDIKYWLLERLEIKNGRNTAGTNAAGFMGNSGPFKLRYLYVHDNTVSGTDNSFGVGGNHWQNSTVEYCWFVNNGCTGTGCGAADNATHIDIYSDYNWNTRATDGLTLPMTDATGFAPYGNTIRYNYAIGTAESIFFKHKGAQYFTRRVTGWQDTYNTYGDNIHHNVLVGPWRIGVLGHQDFVQIYNNIIDDTDIGISLNYGESSYVPLYKSAVYNNTIISADTAIQFRGGASIYVGQLNDMYGYCWNNIIDANSSSGYGEISMRSNTLSISNWYIDKNYSYRPVGSAIVRYWGTDHTAAQFEAQTDTPSPRNYYSAAYDVGNLLYQGTTGADKYRIRSDHIIEGTTAGNGGMNSSHPYLAGVVIPSYVGAANPNDDTWVLGVMNLASVSNLQTAGNGDPSWIEGSGSPPDVTPPASPSGLSVR
jgi:hypothetical protein